MKKIRFKETCWYEMDIQAGIPNHVDESRLLEALKNGEFTQADEVAVFIEHKGGKFEGYTDIDGGETITIEENWLNPTIEILSEQGETEWDNIALLDCSNMRLILDCYRDRLVAELEAIECTVISNQDYDNQDDSIYEGVQLTIVGKHSYAQQYAVTQILEGNGLKCKGLYDDYDEIYYATLEDLTIYQLLSLLDIARRAHPQLDPYKQI